MKLTLAIDLKLLSAMKNQEQKKSTYLAHMDN